MQCTRCGQPLQAGVLFCRACGGPVVGSTPVVVSDDLAGETEAAELTANPEALGYTGFAFQEFRAAPVPGQPVAPPLPGMPLAGQPVPGTPWPGMPLAGQPGTGMYAPYLPGYPPYGMPLMMPAPPKPKNLWTSVGCIISYVALAVLLVFVSLGVGLYVLGSHLGSNAMSQKTVAMKLYAQVTSQTPDLTDSMTSTSDTSWFLYTGSTYGCAIQTDGLHVHVNDSERSFYCLNNETDAGDIAFRVQMHLLSGEGGGLVFRASNGQGDYVFELSQDGSCHVFLSKDASSAPTTLTSGTASSANQGADSLNSLTLIEKGSQYYFYVNGQYAIHMQDATLTDGEVGVFADDYNTPAEAVYTDAEIWDL